MSDVTRVPAGRLWGPIVGYSRAVRRGDLVEVSGTSATLPDGSVVAPGDAYEQARHILHEIVQAMAELGATPADVVRTRVYLTDMQDWEAVGRAHGEVFGDVLPACSFVGIHSLMHPELVVEIEATALVLPDA